MPEGTAKEIAARTVNKERARAGEANQASRTSTNDISSGRRGGLRSHRGAGGRTRDQLYEEAKRRGISGRSKMSKRELEDSGREIEALVEQLLAISCAELRPGSKSGWRTTTLGKYGGVPL